MTLNKRLVRRLLAGALALAAATLTAGSACAQRYYFDFAGGGVSVDATINNLNCTPSCQLTASSDLTGTITVNGVTSAISFNVAGDDAQGADANDNVFHAATGVDDFGIAFDENGNRVAIYSDSNSGMGTGSGGVENLVAVDGGVVDSGDGTLYYGITTQPSPAPAVGGGAWSWLALAAAGLAARRKTLTDWARTGLARGRIAAA